MSATMPGAQRRLVMPLHRAERMSTSPPLVGERFPPVMTWMVLLVVLPLFGQCFYYLAELPPPYILSKAWPVLMAPVAIWAIARVPLPAKGGYVALMAYMMGLTPLISMIKLGNGLFDALTTTVKVWPFSYYFALAGVLVWLNPEPGRLRRIVLALGYGTFGAMLLLWMVAPASWYTSDPSKGKLMLYELERGYRIYMPMFFGVIVLFFLTRTFMRRPSFWPAVGVLVGIALEFYIYKQRASIGAALAVVGWGVLASLPARWRRILAATAAIVVPAAAVLVLLLFADKVETWLGGSLSVRQNSFALATGYLGSDVMNWLFGVGATTRFSTVTLADIFGNAQFYIADIGWVGVVFEYGLVGALMLFGLHVWGYVELRRLARRNGDPFAHALADYVLFLIVTSAVYSLVFTPGEFATVMALAAYLGHRAGRPVAPQGTGHVFIRTAPRRIIGKRHAATAQATVL